MIKPWTNLLVEGIDLEKRVAKLRKVATQWKKDLRRMTKLYKSLKTDDSPKAAKAFGKARKAWQIFNANWERWVFNELLDRSHLSYDDRKDGENIYQVEVREKGWAAHTSIMNLFPMDYDYHTDKHLWAPWALDTTSGGDTRKTQINRYTRAFKKAFDAIDNLIVYEADKISEIIPDHQTNVSGVNVLVKNVNHADYATKWIKKFLKSLPVAVKAIKKAGLKPSLKGFTVEINFKPSTVSGISGGLTAGAYRKEDDTLYIFPLGMSDNLNDSTLVHEIGHRYWFRKVPNRAQKAWEDKINSGMIDVNDDMIDKFCKRYFDTQYGYFKKRKDILADAKANIDDPTLKTVFINLSDRTPIWSVQDKYESYDYNLDSTRGFAKKLAIYTGWMQKVHSGERYTIEFISDYGNTNPAESFAEVFRKWVAGRVGQLGPWTRAFFKEIVRTGGANIREKTTIKPWSTIKF
jgi:hypothetical protein